MTDLHTIAPHEHVRVDEPPALLVVGHGSRDADGVEEFWALSRTIREVAGELPVDFGFIEMAEPLADLAIDRLVERGLTDIVSVPLVLLAAGHLKNDGPATLARARQRHPDVRFRMGRDLGIDPVVLAVVEDRIRAAIGEDDPAEVGVVLVGRGSSDPDACGDLFKFGRLLADGRGLGTVEPAFVSVARPDVPGRARALPPAGRPHDRRRAAAALHRRARAAHLPPGAGLGGRAPRGRRARRRAPRPRPAPGAARARAPPRGRVRRRAHELRPVHLPRAPALLRGQGRDADLADRPRRRARARQAALPAATRAPLAPIELAPRRPGLRPAPAVEVPAGTPPALDVRGLRFAYPDGSPALAGVDLQVAVGERVAVLGPNGAGKTTLVLQLNGMLEGGEGTIAVGGLELGARTRAEVRRRVGIVFQDSDDQLFMPSVRADVAFGPANLGLRGDALRERVDAALERVGLQDEADRAPHQLSAGQRRRAAVAGVLAMEPDVLILDEPSSAMDPAARRELADVLVSLRITTLVVTHDLPYALELCPRAVVLDRGVVVADGATREVLSDEGFMRAHRLELPAGFNPLSA